LMLIPLVWRIVIWGDRFGTMLVGFRQFGALSGGLQKACG
jgi:hypothetical protein